MRNVDVGDDIHRAYSHCCEHRGQVSFNRRLAMLTLRISTLPQYGQGLAIARSVIVDKHNGSIDFETEEGNGTTFIICLPYDGRALTAKAVTV